MTTATTRPAPARQAKTSVVAGIPSPAQPASALTAPLDAGGTMWRLRSLIAMGHDATRIARALRTHPRQIRALLRGQTATVGPDLHDLASQLWNAWWDKRPPERTPAERRAATQARRRAQSCNWCPPLGLDEDYLDQPGYRPYSIYRPATGTAIATDFTPLNGRNARRSA
jgi:hypothetical protein